MVQVNMQDGQAKPKPKFSHSQFQIVLDSKGEEPVQIEAGSWRGIDHIGIRQLFRGRDGTLYYGKQGFNCPVDDFLHLVIALICCYNDATGAALNLIDEAADDDSTVVDVYELVKEEVNSPQEAVSSWKG